MKSTKTILIAILISIAAFSENYAQEKKSYELSLQQAIDLALENHQQLKVSAENVAMHRQQEGITKQQRLPTVAFSANAYYLGDALILDTDLSKVSTVELPNFGNTFSVQASQILFKGGAISKSIELAELQTQLAQLDLTRDKQSVKFLVTSYYLDISKVLNQITVYRQNKLLAEQRLANVTKLYEQDMMTRNEVIRGELQIKDIEQHIITLTNNHRILSNQLSYALNLPNDVLVYPTEQVEEKTVFNLPYYINLAIEQHPSLQYGKKNIDVAKKNVAIIKSELYPTISLFGGYNMQRPLTSSTPVQDLYNNTWQAGISLSYNIDNLFRTKKKVKQANIQVSTMKESQKLNQENIEMEVYSAYTKYQEAVQQVELAKKSQELANENYKIIEAKYLNQLAITAEMTDAATAKLDAELQHTNAEITVVFQYYNLLKSAGIL